MNISLHLPPVTRGVTATEDPRSPGKHCIDFEHLFVEQSRLVLWRTLIPLLSMPAIGSTPLFHLLLKEYAVRAKQNISGHLNATLAAASASPPLTPDELRHVLRRALAKSDSLTEVMRAMDMIMEV